MQGAADGSVMGVRQSKKGCQGQGSLEAPYWFQNATGSLGIGDGGASSIYLALLGPESFLEPVIQGTPCCGLYYDAAWASPGSEAVGKIGSWSTCGL
jgi:hypothetical protein